MNQNSEFVNISVLFFGFVREKTGLAKINLKLKQGTSLDSLKQNLENQFPELKKISSLYRFAVNGVYTSGTILVEKDEVALIPPVGGGSGYITEKPVDPASFLSSSFPPDIGATVVFVGTVRNSSLGTSVKKLKYESYDSMAEKKIYSILSEAKKMFQLKNAELVHRIDEMKPGDVVLIVKVQSNHRKESFQACSWIVDQIKKDVPIWKKEFFSDNEHWVSEN